MKSQIEFTHDSEATAKEVNVKLKDLVSEKLSTTKVMFYGKYNVTDVGIAAGEDIAGWTDEFWVECTLKKEYGGGQVRLFDIRRNEIADNMYMALMNSEIQKIDLLPTTAEDQFFSFMWHQPIFWGLFSKAKLHFKSKLATDEWAAASAFTIEAQIAFLHGPTTSTVVFERIESSSDTIHRIPSGIGLIEDFSVKADTAQYWESAYIKGSDGQPDFEFTELEDAYEYGQLWYDLANLTATADTLTYLRSGPVLIEDYKDREYYFKMSTAAALVLRERKTLADIIPHPFTKVGDAARGRIEPKKIMVYNESSKKLSSQSISTMGFVLADMAKGQSATR